MTILSLNCFGTPLLAPRASARMRLITQAIQILNPDIVCLQEVFLPWHKRIFVSALSQFPYRFVPRNGVLGTGAGLCIFSKISITKARFREFSKVGRGLNFTAADRLVEKGWMDLSFVAPYPFRILHTHLTCNYSRDYHPIHNIGSVQRAQLRDMSAAMKESPRNLPTFVVGDLNIPSDSSLFRSFLKATHSTDLTPGTAPSVRGNHFRFPVLFSPIISHFKVDYILSRGMPSTAVTSWKYVFGQEKLSDHFGILLEITW